MNRWGLTAASGYVARARNRICPQSRGRSQEVETRPQVNQLIQELGNLAWFSQVGTRVAVKLPKGWPISRVHSWHQAVRAMNTRDTNRFLTDSGNDLHRERSMAMGDLKAQARATREFNTWIDTMR